MIVQEALDNAIQTLENRKVESARLSAELLLAHVLEKTRSEVLANPDLPLNAMQESKLNNLINRRSRFEPIPYLIGEVEFYSIPFNISSGVFIPRPETETLVDAALAIANELEYPKIYDIGVGSGAILIAIAMNVDDGEFWGSDISSIALQIAKQNVIRHDLQNYVELREGALLSPLRNQLTKDIDLVVSNPPYIKTNEIPKLDPQVREYEPHIALDGGRDGMNFIKSIIDGAAPLLKPGGHVLIEIDPSQSMMVRTELRRRKLWGEFTVHKDASGNERVVQFIKQ